MLNRDEFMGAVAKSGLTNRELARRIGISKNTLSSKVNGKSFFDTEQIDKICNVLGIEDDKIKVKIFLSKKSQNRDEREVNK